jgi:hypothetical protein
MIDRRAKDRREIERRISEDRRARAREGLQQMRREDERRGRIQRAKVNHFCDRFYYAALAHNSAQK